MSAYFLFDNLEVRDPDRLAQYAAEVAPIVAKFGGRYRAVGGTTEIVEGQWRPTFPVILEFDTAEAARAWYDSAEYQPLKRLRQSAVTTNGVLIEGLPAA